MRRALLALALLLLPLPALAQGVATLVADSVSVAGDSRLIADGNVEVIYDGTRLSAQRITYDRTGDRLVIDGPIFIEGPDGEILTAERAELDPRLENGILRGARLVLEQRLQLAANRIDRIDGRYSALTQTAVTSCQVCGNQEPLWEIRAAQVIHDEEARQLYFESATLRIRGVPVLWVPRMRLPDPTLDRATGLLVPSIRTTDALGIGLKLPYFIRIGDRRDLTFTPYISPDTMTLEARYRQAFLSGIFEINSAVTRDTIREDETRGYVLGGGTFELAPGTIFTLDLAYASDSAYLRDYGYSDLDRLESGLGFYRVTDRSLLETDLTYYQTLRAGEDQSSLPPLVGRFAYDTRIDSFGGALDYGLLGEAFERTGSAIGEDGRDVARLGAHAMWSRDWLLSGGLLAEARAGLDLGYYQVSDDPAFPDRILRTTPSLQATLRWPLISTASGGATHILEPIATLAWSRTSGGDVPNEDSRVVEFDEANLGSLTRFPGEDAREDGARAALGLTWTRIGTSGSQTHLTFGRVYREVPDGDFPISSGLSDATSDWLIAGGIVMPGGLRATARTIFDSDFNFDKTEARFDLVRPGLDLSATYVYLPEEPAEDRATPISEWTLGADYRVNDYWLISTQGRYDVIAAAPVSAELGLEWRNECVTVDLSVSRSYTTSTEVEPVTDFGLAVNLTGFSSGLTAAAPPGRCRNR